MKAWNYSSVLMISGLSLGLFAVGCGDDTTGAGGNGGGAAVSGSNASSSKSSSTHAAATTGAGGQGGAPNDGSICNSGLAIQGSDQAPNFNGCLTANCCATFNPCFADATCNACLQSADPTADGCDTNALFMAESACQDNFCATSICGGMISGLPGFNSCMTKSTCCTSWTACENDAGCNPCLLDATNAGCDTNTLFAPVVTCENANCPTDICETGIGFFITYPNDPSTDSDDGQDVNVDGNKCACTNCSDSIIACADPSGNGSTDPNDPEIQACVACLNADASCGAGAVKDAADAFQTCITTNNCLMN